MDEKIKEMRTDIGIAIHNAKQDYWYIEDDLPYWIAKSLIQKGYRKESDTAKEILTKLLDFVNGWFEGVENNDFAVEFNRISKDLFEKYNGGR